MSRSVPTAILTTALTVLPCFLTPVHASSKNAQGVEKRAGTMTSVVCYPPICTPDGVCDEGPCGRPPR